MRVLRALFVAVVLGATFVTGGARSSAAGRGGGAAATGSVAPLAWTDCGEGAECARLEVPFDYAHPKRATVELAVLRVVARDPSVRIGSLVVNPGGPGAAGTGVARAIAAGAPSEIRDRFDIVGFDPRGTGESSPVRCGADTDAFLALDFSPTSKSERAALLAGARAYSRACKEENGRLLEHVSTLETARDLDLLRGALGDDKLTYLGISYGTYLGAVYADRFPSHVRALVLNGALDPSQSFADMVVQQSVGFERNLQHFLEQCAAEATCAFAQGREPGRAYDDLRARIEQEPLTVADRRLTDSSFDLGVFTLLYDGQTAWPTIADALAAAQMGDGRPLLDSADSYNDRSPDGTYSPLTDAYYAIQCLDGPAIAKQSDRIAAFWKVQARAAKAAPRVGASNAGSYIPCATTLAPVRPARLPVAKDAPPILVVNTTDDPATPLAGAEALARQLPSAVLVTKSGEGHGLIESLSPCVLDIALRYLIELEAPEVDTACP